MATITTVEVAVSRKVSKNYNSTEVSVSYRADIDPQEDPETVRAELSMRCVAAIRAEFGRLQIRDEPTSPQEPRQQPPAPLPPAKSNGHQNGNGKRMLAGVIGKRAE